MMNVQQLKFNFLLKIIARDSLEKENETTDQPETQEAFIGIYN